MNRKLFYNNPVFRIAAPPLFGIVIYLLILMFFDSVEFLADNFFSREVLFIIGLTILFFELNRFVIVILNIIFKSYEKLLLRAGIQYLTAILLSIGSVSLILYQYFVKIEGFSTIRTELITFNSIYIFAAFFYHLYYFSILFLFRRNDDLIMAEQIQRNNLELELNAYKSQINPEFLFQTLEIIIRQLHQDKKKTDELIDHLARVYRYTLDNQNNELVSLKEEINSLKPVLSIFRTKYPNALELILPKNLKEDLDLVPGTLQILFEHAIISNLVSEQMPLTFKISVLQDKLKISYKQNQRITNPGNNSFRIDHLKKTYDYLAPGKFQSIDKQSNMQYEIPLLKVEEE